MKTLAYSPWGGPTDCFPFNKVFDQVVDGSKTMAADAFVLWGGTDIHPSYYGQPHSSYSQAPTLPSARDIWEWKAMKYCLSNNIPIIGVCRGAQFMCAFVGGKLFQHITHHMGNHNMVTNTGEIIDTTSCHHQMLDLHGVPHELLAWSTGRSMCYFTSEDSAPDYVLEQGDAFKEPEVVHFPTIRGIGIQGHPEWAARKSRFVEFCNEQIVALFEETTV